jgi:hypothetical protein
MNKIMVICLLLYATFLPSISYGAKGDAAQKFYGKNIATVEKIWGKSNILSDNTSLPTKYALIDIDGDGRQELYLRNENNGDGGLFCSGGDKIRSITFEMYKSVIYFYGNKIECGGGMGTGVICYDGYELKNSKVKEKFSLDREFSFNAQGQPTVKEFYNKKENGAHEFEAKKFFAKNIDWQILKDKVKWYDYNGLKLSN